MERLAERIKTARNAMAKFAETMAIKEPSAIERDAAIQRFKFTFEAVWKAGKEYLYIIEGIAEGSPKGVIRACRESGLFDNSQTVTALKMADDRNLTVHTYNEALAAEIYHNMKEYVLLMGKWLDSIETKTKAAG